MAMLPRIRVLIADDHPLARLGVETLLRAQPDMQVVGQAEDGEEAVHTALLTQPDVVLLDVHMPGKDGLTVLREIKQALPEARCLMLTATVDPSQVLQAVQAGAVGYLLKDASPDDLLGAIRAVYAGQGALSPAATRQLIDAYHAFPGAERPDVVLTPSERRVLGLLARGLSNQEIANNLGVSVRTVTTHVQHILDKLGVENRVQAALYAREHGLSA
jgi:DNA-binding NarL/FixJ family response regulator